MITKLIEEIQKMINEVRSGLVKTQIVNLKKGSYGVMAPWGYEFVFTRTDGSDFVIAEDADGIRVEYPGITEKLWHIPMIPVVFGKKREARKLAYELINLIAEKA